jgi:hypothetical protein
MEKQRRRDIINDYKEKKVAKGVFAVRCAPSGQTWLGLSRNLDAQQNSIWFSLRIGSHRNKAMQAAWKEHGEAAFELSIVELVDTGELTGYMSESRLKERLVHWLGAMDAQPVVA